MKGTLIGVILSGASPMELLCQTENSKLFLVVRCEKGSGGVVDTIQMLLFHDNVTEPWSEEYNLLRLLSGSF